MCDPFPGRQPTACRCICVLKHTGLIITTGYRTLTGCRTTVSRKLLPFNQSDASITNSDACINMHFLYFQAEDLSCIYGISQQACRQTGDWVQVTFLWPWRCGTFYNRGVQTCVRSTRWTCFNSWGCVIHPSWVYCRRDGTNTTINANRLF